MDFQAGRFYTIPVKGHALFAQCWILYASDHIVFVPWWSGMFRFSAWLELYCSFQPDPFEPNEPVWTSDSVRKTMDLKKSTSEILSKKSESDYLSHYSNMFQRNESEKINFRKWLPKMTEFWIGHDRSFWHWTLWRNFRPRFLKFSAAKSFEILVQMRIWNFGAVESTSGLPLMILMSLGPGQTP